MGRAGPSANASHEGESVVFCESVLWQERAARRCEAVDSTADSDAPVHVMFGLARWLTGDTSQRARRTGMSKTDVQPSSIEGIKRLAKAISKRDAIPHTKALDTASQVSGFGNFQHAHRLLSNRSADAAPARHVVYISTFWRDSETRTSGRETIRVFLSTPLDEMIKPTQYRYAHKLGRFRRHASDHVIDEYRPDSASAALARACGAARVL
ncbi:hypothetical protein EN780_34505, partial [Mesorhizobium sp. M4B.F.Ca.ET.089.01.1.1]